MAKSEREEPVKASYFTHSECLISGCLRLFRLRHEWLSWKYQIPHRSRRSMTFKLMGFIRDEASLEWVFGKHSRRVFNGCAPWLAWVFRQLVIFESQTRMRSQSHNLKAKNAGSSWARKRFNQIYLIDLRKLPELTSERFKLIRRVIQSTPAKDIRTDLVDSQLNCSHCKQFRA